MGHASRLPNDSRTPKSRNRRRGVAAAPAISSPTVIAAGLTPPNHRCCSSIPQISFQHAWYQRPWRTVKNSVSVRRLFGTSGIPGFWQAPWVRRCSRLCSPQQGPRSPPSSGRVSSVLWRRNVQSHARMLVLKMPILATLSFSGSLDRGR